MEESAKDQQSLNAAGGHVLAFGEFVLERDSKRLLRCGEPVPLKPKVYDLLCLLLDQRGRVLSRNELMDALWPRQDIEPSSLTQAVYELRRALGDAGLIENLPRRGYRFAGEVRAPAPAHAAPTPEIARPEPRRRLAVPAAVPALVPVLVLVLASVVLVHWLGQRGDRAEPAIASAAAFSPTRMAVLPFEEFSPDGGQPFLGDGIADSLLRVFTGVEELSVIARASAFAYRGRDIATIARDLEVGSVLQGSVQRSGDRLRITVQLVRTSDQRQLWSQAFDHDAHDIFAAQDEIATQVLRALLGSDVLGIASLPSMRTSTEAHDLYLQGRELWQQRQAASIGRSVELLEQAVALDPDFAPARSELATALYLAPGSRLEKLPRIEAELERALALDPEDAQAHAIRGLLLLDEGRLADSRVALRQALVLRPNDVNILGWLASSYSSAGMLSSAARYTRRAYELDTMNLFARTRLIGLLLAENPPEAVALARQTVRLFPESSLAWTWLIDALDRQGNFEAAVLAAVDALDHVTEAETFVFAIARGFNELGELELADRWRARVPDFRPSVFREFQWLTARGNVQGLVEIVREAMAQHGEVPALLMWQGRALISAGAYDEAWEVLNRVLAAGPALDDPRNVSWAQAEIPILLAGLAHRRGEQARADELEAKVLPVIEFVELDWPLGASEKRFFLDLAMGRYEQAAGRMQKLGAAMEPVTVHMVEHFAFWRPLGATAEAQAFIEEMQRELARQLQRLRAVEIPWLLEPEQWPGSRPG